MSVSANKLASTDMWRHIMKLACIHDEDFENFAGVCRLFHTLKKQHWEVLKRKYEEEFWPIERVFGDYTPRLSLLRFLSKEIVKQIAIVRDATNLSQAEIDEECYKLVRLTYAVRSKHHVSKRKHYFKKITVHLYPLTEVINERDPRWKGYNGYGAIRDLMRSYLDECTETLVIAAVICVQLFPSFHQIERFTWMEKLLQWR